MNFYVHVIGSYDSTFVGPFAASENAVTFKKTVPENFDAYVLSQAELDENFARFGYAEIMSPDWWNN